MDKNNSSRISNIVLKNIRPKKFLPEPGDSIPVIIGIFIAILIGFLLKNPALQDLLTVGAFLSGVLILIPHHSTRRTVTISNSFLLILAFFAGAFLHNQKIILYIIFFVLIFFSSLLRKINSAIAIRALILSTFVLASAQMSTTFKVGIYISFSIAAGVLIIAICQLIPPYKNRFLKQKVTVAKVFKELSIDANLLLEGERNTKAYIESIHMARNILEKLNKNARYNVDFLFELIVRAEIIEDSLNSVYLKENLNKESLNKISEALGKIAENLAKKENKELTFQSYFNEIFKELNNYGLNVDYSLKENLVEERISKEKENVIKSVLKEINIKSPIFIQALRLAIFVMVATVAGNILEYFPSISIENHGFWVSLTTALVLFPDYVDTFNRGIERSLGTIVGAIVGFLLSLLPLGLLGHSIMIFILLAGYVVFRTSGQVWIMFWIVAWICNLEVLKNAPISRSIDTIVGAVIALIACLIWPTWSTNKIDKLLSSWIKEQGKYVSSIANFFKERVGEEKVEVRNSRHKSNHIYQQLITNINKASYEPIFLKSKWNNENLTKIVPIITDISYKISSLNIEKSNINLRAIFERISLTMESLGNLIIEKATNELSYQYSIENLKVDVANESLKVENKKILNNLILDLEKLEQIIKEINRI
ncbi:FUSC family protein [Clostridium sardiniense]|uniref:FUSC family protein n=1 Tax=Clostridium sardiniense TaxID=29369 RepID=UPI003D3493F3